MQPAAALRLKFLHETVGAQRSPGAGVQAQSVRRVICFRLAQPIRPIVYRHPILDARGQE